MPRRKQSEECPGAPSLVCRSLSRLLPILRDGQLSEEEASRVQTHLAICAWCRRQLEAYEAIDRAVTAHLDVQMPPERVLRLRALVSGWLSPETSALEVLAQSQPDSPSEGVSYLLEHPDPPPGAASSRDSDPQTDLRLTATAELTSAQPRTRQSTTLGRGTSAQTQRSPQAGVLRLARLPQLESFDDDAWDCPPEKRRYLADAVRMLRHGPSPAWLMAQRLADRCFTERIAPALHVRVRFVQSYASAQLGALEQACAYLDDALEVSLAIGNLAVFAELAYLHGLFDSRMQHASQAMSYFEMAVEALQSSTDAEPQRPATAELALDILTRLAAQCFLLGNYSSAQTTLADAKQLLTTQPPHAVVAAPIEWTHALLERWRGNLALAFQHALRANACYEAMNTDADYVAHARLRIVAADIALDLAEQAELAAQSSRAERFVWLAQPLIRTAYEYLQGTPDTAGEQLALLSFVRLRRLQALTDDFRPLIEHIARSAQGGGDLPLLGQALTALGQDYAARGELDSALNLYRAALETLAHSQAPALQVWPRRALLRAQEMSA